MPVPSAPMGPDPTNAAELWCVTQSIVSGWMSRTHVSRVRRECPHLFGVLVSSEFTTIFPSPIRGAECTMARSRRMLAIISSKFARALCHSLSVLKLLGACGGGRRWIMHGGGSWVSSWS